MFSHFFNVTYPSLTEGDFPAGKLKNVKILHIQFSKEQIFPITMFTISQLIIYPQILVCPTRNPVSLSAEQAGML